MSAREKCWSEERLRLSTVAHRRLQSLATRRGESQLAVLEEALAMMENRQFFEDCRAKRARFLVQRRTARLLRSAARAART